MLLSEWLSDTRTQPVHAEVFEEKRASPIIFDHISRPWEENAPIPYWKKAEEAILELEDRVYNLTSFSKEAVPGVLIEYKSDQTGSDMARNYRYRLQAPLTEERQSALVQGMIEDMFVSMAANRPDGTIPKWRARPEMCRALTVEGEMIFKFYARLAWVIPEAV